jgi:hypothetical protein
MKSCDSDKVVNPKTNRCVSKAGKIGQQVLADLQNSKKTKVKKEIPTTKEKKKEIPTKEKKKEIPTKEKKNKKTLVKEPKEKTAAKKAQTPKRPPSIVRPKSPVKRTSLVKTEDYVTANLKCMIQYIRESKEGLRPAELNVHDLYKNRIDIKHTVSKSQGYDYELTINYQGRKDDTVYPIGSMKYSGDESVAFKNVTLSQIIKPKDMQSLVDFLQNAKKVGRDDRNVAWYDLSEAEMNWGHLVKDKKMTSLF